ncbi:MAG: hypothetical protein P8Y01_05635 [Woeseiaceae bacterium]
MNDQARKEGILTLVAMAAVATLIAQHIAGKATRDALFLTHFPVERLPLIMMVSAAISVAAVVLMSRLLGRFGPARLIPLLFLLSGGLLLLLWEMVDINPQASAALLYLQISAVNALLISGFWSVINERFDPHSAKKVIARLAAASTFGGLAGGLLAKAVSAVADTNTILLMLAGMHLACGAAVAWIAAGPSSQSARSEERISLLGPLKSSRLIRLMALLALAIATTAAVLDYVLKAEASASLTDEQLISFFSYFYVAVGLGGFLLQSAVGNRALQWLGLGGTMLAWPLAVIATGTLTLFVRSLITVALMRGTANLLYNSFFRSGFEVLYTPIPAEQKRTGKVMIDVGADRAGDIVGGFVVMVILLLPVFTESLLLIVAIGLAVICALLILLLQRNYSRQLAENLETGQLEVEDVDVIDTMPSRTVAETQMAISRDSLLKEIEALRARKQASGDDAAEMAAEAMPVGTESTPSRKPQVQHSDPVLESIADLRSGHASRIREALMSRELTSETVPHVIGLLRDEELVPHVLRALRPVAGRSAGILIDALLDPMHGSTVRRRIPIALGNTDNPIAVFGLLTALRDRDWNVRFRAAEALSGIRQRSRTATIDRQKLDAALGAAIRNLRSRQATIGQGAPSMLQRLELVFLLIGIADNPETLDLCWKALHSDDRWLQGTAAEYLQNLLSPDRWQALEPHLKLAAAEQRGEEKSKDEVAEALHAAADKLADSSTPDDQRN